MKYERPIKNEAAALCRPPRGGRGLKCICHHLVSGILKSPPSRGAWIEIPISVMPNAATRSSPPSRGAWIEIVAL